MGKVGRQESDGGGVNYAEMEAGPEMDRAIAERVMGWHARGFDGKWHDWYDQHEFVRGLSRWQPSTNIAHAWEVLTAIRQRLFSVRNRFSDEVKAQMVTASGEHIAWPDALFFLGPEHICRAALMALKPEGE